MSTQPAPPLGQKVLAVVALLFGLLTIFKSGMVLFGPKSAGEAVGAFVPFVVWFNFFAGFFYIITATFMWRGKACALRGAMIIAGSTFLVALVFAVHVALGGSFEMQTVGALVLRVGFWAGVAAFLFKLQQRLAGVKTK